jgi:GAF domain-containing protein
MGRRAKPSNGKADGKRPPAGKSPKDAGAKDRDLGKRLAEALRREAEAQEQQAATAEILRVISSSPTDVQPVFDTIVRNARQLLDGHTVSVARRIGDELRLMAFSSTDAAGETVLKALFPIRLDRIPVITRLMRERTPVVVTDTEADPEIPEDMRQLSRARGWRSVVWMPMIREDTAIGVIAVSRPEPGGFADGEVALLKTFADQAVIAIENVRLFTELEARNRDLTATSEILRVISTSPTDVQPVFDAIVASAARLCDALFSALGTFDGELMDIVAAHNWTPAAWDAARRTWPARPNRALASGRTILERAVVHIPDVELDREWDSPEMSHAVGFRSILSVPMMRDDKPVGVIAVGRAAPGPFSDSQIALLKTFADQAVIAIENVRLFTELQQKNEALTQAHAQVSEALDQQTATAEILRVISSSPTDVQPVFDTIARSASALCGGHYAIVVRFDGELLHLVAQHNARPEAAGATGRLFPRRPGRDIAAGRAILDRAIVHIPDVERDSDYTPDAIRAGIARSYLTAPMLREGVPVGAIGVSRATAGPFNPEQITLLQTFADQAVIAIENVRLFAELEASNRNLTESLNRQTATADILQAVSRSPTDTQPVFAAIADSALRLFRAWTATVFRLEGEFLRPLAARGGLPGSGEAVQYRESQRVTRDSVSGRCVVDRSIVHVADFETDPDAPAWTREIAPARGFRAALGVPLLRDSEPIGTIAVSRVEPGRFSDGEISLLRTFADQAVIAIENVRLFTELQASNRELTTALDKQTATSDILRVISRSQTDVQPVFGAIVASAVRLLRGHYGALTRLVGDQIELAATTFSTGVEDPAVKAAFPRPLHSESVHAQAIRHRGPVNIADAQTGPAVSEERRAVARARGYRSLVAVPLLRQDEALGTIAITRREAGGFTDDEIALLQTFADQAVIAIENARLLSELQARTQELTRSVGELTALGEVGRALSSTLDLETVLNTIVARASQLAGTDACTVYEYDEATGEFHWRATANLDDEVEAVARRTPIPRGVGAQGRMAVTRAPVQIPDIAAEDAYEGPLRDVLLRTGTRAVLAVPLLQDDRLVGGLTVNRKTPGEFSPETVELLKTFATQSALAINNARLFREIEDKSRQLEIASLHKSQFLASMSHELRTPLNGILGFTEMILDNVYGEVLPELGEPLTEIQNSGRHLLRLINNVLDLSKIEAGRMELALGDYAVQDTVAQVRASLQSLATAKGLEFVTAVPPDLPLAHGDGGRITQCLTNLAGNAIKFTRQGRVEIAVELQGELLVYRVSDTGIGIEPDRISTLFTEFRQADPTIASEFGGSGLGLSITRKFAEMHGGRVWAESERGKGSSFFLAVPLRLGGRVPE